MKNNFYVCIEVVILSALLPLIMIPIIIFLWGDIFAEGLLLRIAILFLMFAEIATGKYHVIDGIEKRNCVVRMAFYVFVSVWVLSNGVMYSKNVMNL